ncbi:MAG: methyltransferase [Cetobacterium sp.]|uniref:tRNA1(Val) (adenine(37)-N6)-methyltransferase n=1 Tax=unclassified Cetobacterium TaxID=2630983 RepID=UPI00163C5285|nr:methyltransferase [Cetobacterium sp. 2A]MBC2855838.1 methyltransferase [Cetobacterium sp. 2A]
MLLENEDITILDDKHNLIQSKNGFRFGIDAVLLSDFYEAKKTSKVLEIGTGNGIISILLKIKEKIIKVTAIEIQEEVASLAKRNVIFNSMQDSIDVIECDLNNYKESNSYDCIVCNPPYMTIDGKLINDDNSKSIARHELKLDLKGLIKNSKRILKPRGEIFLVHRSYRFTEIARELEDNGFSIKRVKFVYFSKSTNSNLVLVQASKGRKNILEIEPPLFLDEN